MAQLDELAPATKRVTRYLGVDPGLRRTGYAVLESTSGGVRLIEGGVIKADTDAPLGHRVREITSGIRDVIAEFTPQAAAIEQVFSHTKHPKAALLMAHARGGLLLALAEAEVPVMHFTPAQIKKLLTGSGRANKEQMQHAVRTELKLESILEPNDVADAAAIAVCLSYSLKFA